MKVSEIERIKEIGCRSVSPGDFKALVEFALECATELETKSCVSLDRFEPLPEDVKKQLFGSQGDTEVTESDK